MSGESFIQGIKSGVKGALIGGAIGGAIGGISNGINANRHGGNFWTGEGATFDTLAIPSDTNEVGEGLEYSTKYAKEFSDEYFGNIEGLNELYADGSMPTGYTKKGDVVFNRSGAKVSGSTRYLGKGKSDVYMYKSSFAGKEKLYLTMGHEYLHVSYNHAGIGFSNHLENAKHASIYQWQFEQARAWNYNVDGYKSAFDRLIEYYTPKYHYSKFGFFVFDVKLW